MACYTYRLLSSEEKALCDVQCTQCAVQGAQDTKCRAMCSAEGCSNCWALQVARQWDRGFGKRDGVRQRRQEEGADRVVWTGPTMVIAEHGRKRDV